MPKKGKKKVKDIPQLIKAKLENKNEGDLDDSGKPEDINMGYLEEKNKKTNAEKQEEADDGTGGNGDYEAAHIRGETVGENVAVRENVPHDDNEQEGEHANESEEKKAVDGMVEIADGVEVDMKSGGELSMTGGGKVGIADEGKLNMKGIGKAEMQAESERGDGDLVAENVIGHGDLAENVIRRNNGDIENKRDAESETEAVSADEQEQNSAGSLNGNIETMEVGDHTVLGVGDGNGEQITEVVQAERSNFWSILEKLTWTQVYLAILGMVVFVLIIYVFIVHHGN